MNGALAEKEYLAGSTETRRKVKKSDNPAADPESFLKMRGFNLFTREKRKGIKQSYLLERNLWKQKNQESY